MPLYIPENYGGVALSGEGLTGHMKPIPKEEPEVCGDKQEPSPRKEASDPCPDRDKGGKPPVCVPQKSGCLWGRGLPIDANELLLLALILLLRSEGEQNNELALLLLLLLAVR